MSSKNKQQASKRASRDENRGKYRDTEYECIKEYTQPVTNTRQSARTRRQPAKLRGSSTLDVSQAQSTVEQCDIPLRGDQISGSWDPDPNWTPPLLLENCNEGDNSEDNSEIDTREIDRQCYLNRLCDPNLQPRVNFQNGIILLFTKIFSQFPNKCPTSSAV